MNTIRHTVMLAKPGIPLRAAIPSGIPACAGMTNGLGIQLTAVAEG